MRKFFSVLLVSFICFILAGNVFAVGNEALISLDSPASSQTCKPGDNVSITGKAQNVQQVSIMVCNAAGGIAYVAQPPVVNGAFSTKFQLNNDAVEGTYTIKIGAEGLAGPVGFTFKVSKDSTSPPTDDNTSPDEGPTTPPVVDPAPSGGGSGGGGGGGALMPQATVNTNTGAATVTPSAGGTVSLGSAASIEVPAHALKGTDKTEVKVQAVTTPPAVPAGFRLAGNVYEFSVGGENSYSFNKDVSIKLSFDPNAIAANEIPVIEYYDQALGQWVNLGGTVSGNIVSVQVNHFTKFAVMAVQKGEKTPSGASAVSLNDISNHWALSNINKLVALGAINGYSDGSFKPDNTITRAEFAVVLVKAFKIGNTGGKTFADTTTHWARDYIAAAAAGGIINGYNDATFGPDQLITREQMAVMIVKAARLTVPSVETSYADSSSISDWAREAMVTMVQHGIMKGYTNNTIRPQSKATRAEAVTVIANSLNLK